MKSNNIDKLIAKWLPKALEDKATIKRLVRVFRGTFTAKRQQAR